ncbi:hypothetical protein QE152_g9451 [Popillia japonica]|uniref:Uncharacterized protein n=1 Tax=Popillia japonica TaxID=7064 RepID=A0AAW1LXZ7_POPJA
MYTAVLVPVILLLIYTQFVVTQNTILKINNRNDDLNNRKPILLPLQVIYEDQKSANQPEVEFVRPVKAEELHNLASENPVLATLLLSYNLHISADSPGFNHPQHLPINPYVALLLSHYGRYIPLSSGSSSSGRGIYGYTAANNYHNNLPFGSYKIHTDRDV